MKRNTHKQTDSQLRAPLRQTQQTSRAGPGLRLPKQHHVPTSEELEDEHRALEEKYQRLLKKRQEIDEQIADTIEALENDRMVTELLKQLKSDE